ncbi:MAG: hypothetical protein R2762_10395 [Bryobacteraceae bacterium]
MDLREYYGKIRAATESIQSEFVIVVSKPTPDGGREGVKTEVHRHLAARLLADVKARLANEEETAAYYEAQREALKKSEAAVEEGRVQLAVLSEADLQMLAKNLKSERQ